MTDCADRARRNWPDLAFWEADWPALAGRLARERAAHEVLPPEGRVFAALERSAAARTRVVILGQDPYPTPGHANGLAFSVAPEVTPLPRSLGNIFRELQEDIGGAPATGDLCGWADQGVLLLNTALTVRAGEAGSHARLGWAPLIAQVIAELARRDGLVWILWGRHAQARRAAIEAGDGRKRLVIESAHPSPLSARRGFFGSRPFSRANTHLAAQGLDPVDWIA